MDYQLTITTPGQPPTHRTIAGDTPSELAEAVHRHARGWLGSTRVDVRLEPTTLTGSITSHGAFAGEFVLVPVVEVEPSPIEGGIRGGWTLADLQRLARTAVLNAPFFSAGDRQDYYDEALSAIFMRLVSSDDEPRRSDLLHAADRAITDLVRGQRRDRGYREADEQFRIKWHPQFFRYWFHDPGVDLSERIAERVAVHQVLDALRPDERAAVEALAACGFYDDAAESLGITVACLKQRLRMARRRFLRLWHYPEAPGPRWRQDRRRATNPRKDVCANGHEYTPENAGFRSAGARRGERYCKACSRESNARSYARRKANGVAA
ncbi:hypothetical protein ACFV4E_22730 [Streptomyces hygroscopicus]|uniref:hypothetical protein n=1 Tax=Streptomyces hygroscopicus TaxID=1912 RepID=UPI0036B96D55